MVHIMPRARSKKPSTAEKIARTSVTLPVEHYSELERIAESNQVSVAWVVRQAVAKYLVDRWPLLAEKKEP